MCESMTSQANLLRTFLRHVEDRGEETAAMVKRSGRYVDVTWHEMWVEARRVARGLVALGLEPGDRACIIAATKLEWCTTDLGILASGGVTVPIYPSSFPSFFPTESTYGRTSILKRRTLICQ